ncbi:MAG: transketolase [Candidatus Marinimicrobia bacterium]|nr:transketolase [Candidatus Neomarinimicrobiota bacterium]
MKKDRLFINTIRALAMDGVQKANSGHPGAPMGLAPVAYTLWKNNMKFNPNNPQWLNRDRFVLSNGHASMLIYSLLYTFGFDMTLEDLKNFRQIGSRCPGHPEFRAVPGVEMTTGPLGQGAATSVGFAIAEKWLAKKYNKDDIKLIDYKTFVIMGDGCMMEGISSEAASLAGHLKLNNLVWIYDHNKITIEGETNLAFTENVAQRFKAYGWKTYHVTDVNNLDALQAGFDLAIGDSDGPVLLIVDTNIGYGSPNLQDKEEAHGAPLGIEEIKKTKKYYGLDPETHFFVPDEMKDFRAEMEERGVQQEMDWNKLFDRYAATYPDEAKELLMIQNGQLPSEWDKDLEAFAADEKGLATRASGGKVLNRIAINIPWMIGGSADLAPSNKSRLEKFDSITAENFSGRNLHYGVREHAMGAITNGIALSKLQTFCATFFVFSDYMKPAIRMAAMMKLPVKYIFTHDSIGVGEDGPTHQPVEHLAALRSIPGLNVIRPCDANELQELWRWAMLQKEQPSAFVLTRQNLPTLDREKFASEKLAIKGGYVIKDVTGDKIDAIIIATGSEVSISMAAAEKLEADGLHVRVVSMPCQELYDSQDREYKESVLPSNITKRIAVEAASSFGWHKYTGIGENITIDCYGESGPAGELFKKFGFTAENIANKVKELV